ncbi:hypothetical protein J2T25_003582 [Citrobacter amalonaticus]|nr:hypothetical protein [Citrobacter amalonaticus]
MSWRPILYLIVTLDPALSARRGFLRLVQR